MPTALTTKANLYTIFEVASGDTSQDALLNLYITEATQAICSYCGVKDFGLVTGQTEIKSGANAPALTLDQLPVVGFSVTGDTVSGSGTVSNLSSVTGLFVNQSVSGPGIPAGSIVGSVGASSVTLTNAAGAAVTATATATGAALTFGIALWDDDNALGGSAPGAFAQSTMLVEGQDYWVDWDNGPGGVSRSGVVYSAGGYWFRPAVWVWGLVAAQPGPPTGNVKVQYTSGYSAIPADLQAACELLIARMRTVGPWGAGVQAMSDAGRSASLAQAAKMGLLQPEISTLLSPYKKFTLTGGW